MYIEQAKLDLQSRLVRGTSKAIERKEQCLVWITHCGSKGAERPDLDVGSERYKQSSDDTSKPAIKQANGR